MFILLIIKRYRSLRDRSYSQSHLPLKEQPTIEGHSVRALYLTTAAADLGGEYLDVAKRLWDDAVDKKMYATGGLGSRPRVSLSHPEHLTDRRLILSRPRGSTLYHIICLSRQTKAGAMPKRAPVSPV